VGIYQGGTRRKSEKRGRKKNLSGGNPGGKQRENQKGYQGNQGGKQWRQSGNFKRNQVKTQ
jgi:hypothetical protein